MSTPNSLAAALAQVQANLPQIAKGETATVQTKQGGSYKYSYADLADVSQVILPLLGAVGLAWTTRPTLADGRFVLVYELLHASGDSIRGEYPLPGSGTPQEIGSAITYARRYALCAVTGVAPAADDDDGAAATHRAQREQFEDARPARPAVDPEAARQNVLANARAAIDASPAGGLRAIEDRIGQYLKNGTITAEDQSELAERIIARWSELEGNRERSLPEQPEQPAMDADWPEPARPGGSDPA